MVVEKRKVLGKKVSKLRKEVVAKRPMAQNELDAFEEAEAAALVAPVVSSPLQFCPLPQFGRPSVASRIALFLPSLTFLR